VRLAVGIDVGGTKVAALRVDPEGRILDRSTVPTPSGDSGTVMDALIEAARPLVTPEVVAVGVGVAGLVDHESGVLRFSPNLPFRAHPMAEEMRSRTGLPCVIDNDANAAAWAEYRFGASRGARHMLLVIVGTGIGGGIVFDGHLFRGAHGFAGEIGHVVVDPQGPLCGCGNRGCWEQMASGQALERLGRRAVEEHPGSRLTLLSQGDPANVDGSLVTRAAEEGDDIACDIVSRVGTVLGRGLAGLVNVMDPDILVVGGGVATTGDLLLAPARSAFAENVEAVGHRPETPIVQAQLGNDGGAIGAAVMALEEVDR